MNYRSMLYSLLALVVVFLAVKYDVPKNMHIAAMNLLYGNDMKKIPGFLIVVDPLIPELENAGLTRDSLLLAAMARVKEAGIQTLTVEDWQERPDKPSLNITINATKSGNDLFQYSAVIGVEKNDPRDTAGTYRAKVDTIWGTSGMGEGNVADIRLKIDEMLDLFIKAHAGV